MIVASFVWTKHRNLTDERTDRQKGRDYYSICIASNADALSKFKCCVLQLRSVCIIYCLLSKAIHMGFAPETINPFTNSQPQSSTELLCYCTLSLSI